MGLGILGAISGNNKIGQLGNLVGMMGNNQNQMGMMGNMLG
jgi:hypothetical protein